MLRFHRFLLAGLWEPEFGSAEDPEAFAWLHAYSPYHRIQPGTAYPAVLATAAAGDGRVAPLHARKFVAQLQHATSSTRPVLLRHDDDAGHGPGKAIARLTEEYTDLLAFLFWQLRVAG
jgi:prolyl oligopeptidase